MSKKQKPGLLRFHIYLEKLEMILLSASRNNNPALYLYQNDSRTVLFMLEGLCRIYRKVLSSSRIKKLLLLFKEVEDALGVIDYYDSLAQWSEVNSQLELQAHFTKEYQKALLAFEDVLNKRKWLVFKKKRNLRIKKIDKQLDKTKWQKEKKERKSLNKFFASVCEKIIERSKVLDFSLLEDGIHEFRRNIRWLSIYSQCLLGIIQLKTDELNLKYNKYLTKETVNSPFNKMPDNVLNITEIQISQSLFLSLSYLIKELGTLKDEGAIIQAISEFYTHKGYDEQQALNEAESLVNKRSLKEIKSLAKNLIDKFSKDQVIETMKIDFSN